MKNLVEMSGITKRFPGVTALQDVNFTVKKGEILCLLGENGAGKSTLMKVLTGVYKPDGGSIIFQDEEINLNSTRDAYELGINIIFQEFNLCPNLSAMENVFLGNENKGPQGFFSYKETRRKAREFFDRLKIDIDPDIPVEKLGVAQQQMVEIAKALAYETKVLIMDEPTSALADTEIENLFAIMQNLKNRGISIVFISHKLEEVLKITDRIIVLRDGKNSGEIKTEKADESALVSMMVGRELGHLYSNRKTGPSGEVVFKAEDISGPPHFQKVSFEVRKGEIVGLAGLIGAGRTELAKLIIGAEKKKSGTIYLHGEKKEINGPDAAVKANIAYLPEDRKNLALILPMSTRENITMSIHTKLLSVLRLIKGRTEREIVDKYVNDLQIKVTSREQVVETLSGGNQQKVVIAKALAILPRFLILDEPTRGIDVSAKAEVHRIIAGLADQGVSILVISSELPEILHLSNRILVMCKGRITADYLKDETSQEQIMASAIGLDSCG